MKRLLLKFLLAFAVALMFSAQTQATSVTLDTLIPSSSTFISSTFVSGNLTFGDFSWSSIALGVPANAAASVTISSVGSGTSSDPYGIRLSFSQFFLPGDPLGSSPLAFLDGSLQYSVTSSDPRGLSTVLLSVNSTGDGISVSENVALTSGGTPFSPTLMAGTGLGTTDVLHLPTGTQILFVDKDIMVYDDPGDSRINYIEQRFSVPDMSSSLALFPLGLLATAIFLKRFRTLPEIS